MEGVRGEQTQYVQPVSDTGQLSSRGMLASDLRDLGVVGGDVLMAHASLRAVGPMLDGPDTLIAAMLEATAPGGTVLAYTDWEAPYRHAWRNGPPPLEMRNAIAAFDPVRSRAARDNGALAEFLRTWPEARRSRNPGASVAAIGARADWLTADHPLDYGYGEGSPFARLIECGGKVLMIGAPLETMTLLHHAEHLADLVNKRVVRFEVPLATSGNIDWRTIEEYNTAMPVVAGFEDDYFGTIVSEFLETNRGRRGLVGNAPSVVVEAGPMVEFAVEWIESHARRRPPAQGTVTDDFQRT